MEKFLDKNFLEDIKNLVVEELTKAGVKVEKEEFKYIPVGISARHVHVSKKDLEILFGFGYNLTKFKDISQPGQFASNEKVILVGPKGKIDNVRILGPLRNETQVELSSSDAIKIGINVPVRESGNLENTPGIKIIGPKGELTLQRGCIIADRHIHMTPLDAINYKVSNGQKVRVKVEGIKGGIMDNVFIKVRDDFALDMHIDVDDANAFGIKNGDNLEMII